jgi:hypothetical protein
MNLKTAALAARARVGKARPRNDLSAATGILAWGAICIGVWAVIVCGLLRLL